MKPGNLIRFFDERLVEVIGLFLGGNPLDGYRILVGDKVMVALEMIQVELVEEMNRNRCGEFPEDLKEVMKILKVGDDVQSSAG